MSENIPYIIAENGYYYVAYKEKVKVPEVVVSSKGVANGLSEEYNDGWDFGPDSYSPTSTSAIPYTQTAGIKEAILTGKHVVVLEGVYQIYEEIVPNNILDIEFGGFGLVDISTLDTPQCYIQQNTAGLNIIHVTQPLDVLKVKGLAGVFATGLSSTGHVFFIDAKIWLDAHPPTDLSQTTMAGSFQLTDIYGANQDQNHYVLYLDNVLDGNIHNVFGSGYGGFYHFGTYIPSSATVGLNSGNFTMSGYWQYNNIANSTSPCNVNVIDYSCISNQSGINSKINLITNRGSFIDINFSAIASGIAAINFQTMTNSVGAQLITLLHATADDNDTTPSGQELLFNIPFTQGIEYIEIGAHPTGAVYSPNTGSATYIGADLQFTSTSNTQSKLITNGFFNFLAPVQFTYYIDSSISQTTVDGTTAGTVVYSQPFAGTSYKKVIFYFNDYENDTTTDQTISPPAGFTTIAAIIVNTTGLTITVASNGTITITSPDSTTTYSGIVIVEGY